MIECCYAACKASYSEEVIFAINKFKLSILTASCLSVDLNPGEYMAWHSYEDKTRFAYAIILAYSVLEELGLEIKSNKDNPSRFQNGEWNPHVKHDLETRLKIAGVDLNEEMIWYDRGSNSKKIRSIPEVEPMFYSTGNSINDKKVSIVDAISHLSYLRSSVSAHKFGSKINDLTIYDVKSAQYLTQLILMFKLGMLL